MTKKEAALAEYFGIEVPCKNPEITNVPIVEYALLEKILGPLDVPVLPSEDVFLCGGAMLRWFTGKGIETDYDYFFKTKEDADIWVKSTHGIFTISGYQGNLTKEEADEVCLDENGKFSEVPEESIISEDIRAVNLSTEDGKKVQAVYVIRGMNPSEVISTFDLTISAIGTDGANVYMNEHTIVDMLRRRLRINMIHHPLSTARRIFKYAKRGYFACNGTLIEMSKAVVANPSDKVISLD